ncbi:hypothetical protein DFQ30_009533, partial [Apophysomyces sp. BC1015]
TNGITSQPINIILPAPPTENTSPFVNLIPSDTENDASILATTVRGELRFWYSWRAAVHTPEIYQSQRLRLTANDRVTHVAYLSKNWAAAGTATGDVFLMNIIVERDNYDLRVSLLQQHNQLSDRLASWLPSTLLSPIFSAVLPSNRPSNFGKVIRIIGVTQCNHTMVLTTTHLQKWTFKDQNITELVSEINIIPTIKESLKKHLLSTNVIDPMKVNIQDMAQYRSDGWAILVSYHVPQMGEYWQFAVVIVKDRVAHETSAESLDTRLFETHYEFADAFSLPCSVTLNVVKRRPTLSVSNDGTIAFVVVEDTVVAVSLSRQSAFEESVVLRKSLGDTVLCAAIEESKASNGEVEPYTVACIFTAKSGLLEFQIDNHQIAASRSEGNIYSYSDGEDDITSQQIDRATAVLKSRLEQAVLFDEYDEKNSNCDYEENELLILMNISFFVKGTPLSFPLQPEVGQGSIRDAALLLSQEILNNGMALEKNDLLQKLESKDRKSLLLNVEMCRVACALWEFYTERKQESVGIFTIRKNVWIDAIKSVCSFEIDTSGDRAIEDFLKKDIGKLYEFLNHLSEQPFIDKEKSEYDERRWAVYEICNIILKAVENARDFEDDNWEHYHMPENEYMWPVNYYSILERIFRTTDSCFTEYTENVSPDLEHDGSLQKSISSGTHLEKLELPAGQQRELAGLVARMLLSALEIMMKYEYLHPQETRYKEMQKYICDALVGDKCSEDGFSLDIMKMAKEYKIFTILVDITQRLEARTVKERTRNYLEEYGKDYGFELFDWYLSHGQERSILKLDESYDDIVTEYLIKNQNIEVSWEHFMRIGKLGLTLTALRSLLRKKRKLAQRKILLSYAKLVCMTMIKENGHHLSASEVLESVEMKDISMALELVNTQMQLLDEFDSLLNIHNQPHFDNMHKKAEVITGLVAKELLQQQGSEKLGAFTDQVEQLCMGQMLSCQDFVSVVTLLDKGSQVRDKLIPVSYFSDGLFEISACMHKLPISVFLEGPVDITCEEV